ncbi:hypothetical protein [Kitasatospora sp. NPDC088134]|uniref:hypothetical protein n=1 Tax=Kitasatospora sp. NPDC088134 TaxID=3364071 RepID=UPI0037F905E3
MARGDGARALEVYLRCLPLARATGNRRREVQVLDGTGRALHLLGRVEEGSEFRRTAAAARHRAAPGALPELP